MMTPEILEMVSETAEVRKTLKLSRREQAQWAMAHVLEDVPEEEPEALCDLEMTLQ